MNPEDIDFTELVEYLDKKFEYNGGEPVILGFYTISKEIFEYTNRPGYPNSITEMSQVRDIIHVLAETNVLIQYPPRNQFEEPKYILDHD